MTNPYTPVASQLDQYASQLETLSLQIAAQPHYDAHLELLLDSPVHQLRLALTTLEDALHHHRQQGQAERIIQDLGHVQLTHPPT